MKPFKEAPTQEQWERMGEIAFGPQSRETLKLLHELSQVSVDERFTVEACTRITEDGTGTRSVSVSGSCLSGDNDQRFEIMAQDRLDGEFHFRAWADCVRLRPGRLQPRSFGTITEAMKFCVQWIQDATNIASGSVCEEAE